MLVGLACRAEGQESEGSVVCHAYGCRCNRRVRTTCAVKKYMAHPRHSSVLTVMDWWMDDVNARATVVDNYRTIESIRRIYRERYSR